MPRNDVQLTLLSGYTFDVRMGEAHIMVDLQPPEGHGRGATPLKLLLASLAGCAAMDVVSILRKGRQPLEGLMVSVVGDRVQEHPRRYTRLVATFEAWGEGLDAAAVERAVALSHEKYCSVAGTLRAGAIVESVVRVSVAAPEPPAIDPATLP